MTLRPLLVVLNIPSWRYLTEKNGKCAQSELTLIGLIEMISKVRFSLELSFAEASVKTKMVDCGHDDSSASSRPLKASSGQSPPPLTGRAHVALESALASEKVRTGPKPGSSSKNTPTTEFQQKVIK